MLAKRIIPCLDCDLQVPEGRVVKGVEFKEIKYAGNPVDLATKLFNEIAPKYVGRQGGYTRIIRKGQRRGDAAEVAILKLV